MKIKLCKFESVFVFCGENETLNKNNLRYVGSSLFYFTQFVVDKLNIVYPDRSYTLIKNKDFSSAHLLDYNECIDLYEVIRKGDTIESPVYIRILELIKLILAEWDE